MGNITVQEGSNARKSLSTVDVENPAKDIVMANPDLQYSVRIVDDCSK